MRSLVTFEVEHGESTDNFNQFIQDAISNENWIEGITVNNYKVNVDVPACFELEG